MGQALCPCPRGTVSLAGARYVVLQRLGEGGSSYVELVEGLRDGRAHALKRIVCHDAEASGAALREVEMHRLLAHPHVLRLEAHGLVDKGATREAWLLLPFFERGTLWSEVEALRDKGAFMGEERIVLVLRGICRGLEAIHAKGYAHRDLKPTNVLLGDDDQPVLMDLGSVNQARIEDWAAQHCTISYRAPELFTVDSQCVIDERTDVWVLARPGAAAALHDGGEPPGAAVRRPHPGPAGGAAASTAGPGHHPHLSPAALPPPPPGWVSKHGVSTAMPPAPIGRAQLLAVEAAGSQPPLGGPGCPELACAGLGAVPTAQPQGALAQL
ncbi:serine/threonine-protein kinase 16 isoform X2 [Alligator mississippiensis]|uniref:serine/threonine-protein kinase 16 isoform X2 n=1 Tax=Alligator mississippiensis TaxID=8496 RepID=UPI00287735EE|nr:serine/threonine-protein kinase 16 isoform X2 [Alligator mississippiensis]